MADLASKDDSLVARLRAAAAGHRIVLAAIAGAPPYTGIADEAADEIERRDQQLKESVDHEVEYTREIARLREALTHAHESADDLLEDIQLDGLHGRWWYCKAEVLVSDLRADLGPEPGSTP